MSRSVQRWTLFVDESGDFADPDDTVAVAGFMVKEGGIYRPEAIVKALKAAAPWFPWPLHASFLNQPAYVAAAAYRLAPEKLDGARPGFAAAVREAAATCELLAPAEFALVIRGIASGGKIDFRLLRRLRHIIRSRAPHTLTKIEDAARDAWRDVQLVSERLLSARDSMDRPLACFVAAAETNSGASDESATDRYFALLIAAVDRAASLVKRCGGAHRLALNVQQRDVSDSLSRAPRALTPQHVGQAVAPLRARHPEVHIVPMEIAPYGPDVSVEYILADFLANRSRKELRDIVNPLPVVEDSLGRWFGTSMRSGQPIRSHLAASGEAFSFLLEVGGATLDVVPPRRRWACEQALQWRGVSA